jgi:aminopeptidase N
MLRFELGDKLFWKAIKHYANKHKHTNVTTPDLQHAIEESTGRNMDRFFEQWVYGAGHPQLNVSWEWDDGAKQAKVTVKQTQSKEHSTAEVFHTPVGIDFVFDRGHQDFRVRLAEREQSFYFALREKPKMMRFDPGGWLLKTLEYKRGQEQLIFALQKDEDVLGRIDAAKELGKLATKEAVAALKQAVQKDKFFGVQAEAARALGAIGSEAALDALLACTKVEPSRARRGVMAALGTFRDEAPDNRGARAAAELEQVLAKGDKSYYVEAEVVASMGKTRSKRAFAALQKALAKESHNNVIRLRAFEGFGELRDQRAVPIAVEWTRYGKPMQARMGAIGCLGRLGNYADKKDSIRDRLVALLDDTDLRVRMAAVGALVELGDDKAVGALEGLAARELDGRVIRGARTAAARLREGRDKGEEVKKLREELDKMRQEQKTLKDRLEKIESPKTGASRNGARPSERTVAARKAKPAARTNSRRAGKRR